MALNKAELEAPKRWGASKKEKNRGTYLIQPQSTTSLLHKTITHSTGAGVHPPTIYEPTIHGPKLLRRHNSCMIGFLECKAFLNLLIHIQPQSSSLPKLLNSKAMQVCGSILCSLSRSIQIALSISEDLASNFFIFPTILSTNLHHTTVNNQFK